MTKGINNYMWRGGVAEYPNHYLMKKNRLIILLQNPKCEICGKTATEVHHKDGSKNNHSLNNLQAICHKCNSRIRFKPNNSKYRRLYKMDLEELNNKYGFCVYQRLRMNYPLSAPKYTRFNSKFIRLYGMSINKIIQKIGFSYWTIYVWHKKKILNSILLSNPKYFATRKIIKE